MRTLPEQVLCLELFLFRVFLISLIAIIEVYGGEEGIRTLVTIAREHAFQAGALSHSATSPSTRIVHQKNVLIKICYLIKIKYIKIMQGLNLITSL